jgi:hypothetical protein
LTPFLGLRVLGSDARHLEVTHAKLDALRGRKLTFVDEISIDKLWIRAVPCR